MASGKRASMREGPLAALFRKTEEEGLHGEGVPPQQAKPSRAGAGVPRGPRPGAAPGVPRPAGRARAASRAAVGPQAAAGARDRAPERRERRAARTPEQRLREVFSTDIPENIMELSPSAADRAALRPRGAARVGRREPGQVLQPVLRVVGVGGAGVNAVNRMIEAGVEGVDFIAINTDLQSLQQSSADTVLHIGSETTRGLGSGSNPDLGRQAAMEQHDQIKALLKGADMVFIAAGSGGGTGTGAAPVVARDRARARRAGGRHRHEAVLVRGHAPRRAGRARASRSSRARWTR